MVYKVAGKLLYAFLRRRKVSSDAIDVSLAAFGRKEIEIAEVYLQNSWILSACLFIDEVVYFRMKCQDSCT